MQVIIARVSERFDGSGVQGTWQDLKVESENASGMVRESVENASSLVEEGVEQNGLLTGEHAEDFSIL